MKKIVVIGGGTMGLDIAQVFARNGYDVVVRDIKDEIIQASEARLNKGLDKLVSKGKLDEAKKAEILSHMSFTTELAAAADADLVVEAAIGKEPVEVNEAPGFVVNKILVPMINEGIDLVYTGVASVEGVDTAMKLGANHPMGPLALGDLIGLDVCLAIMDTLYDETHDPKYRASLLLRKMVRAGKLGRKTGIGFYDYSKK